MMRFLLSLLLPATERPVWMRFATVVLAVAIAIGGRILLYPWLGAKAPFALLLPAIVASAWFGGTFYGIIATVVGGIAATWLFIEPAGSSLLPAPGDLVVSTLFFFEGAVASLMIGVLRRAVHAWRGERKRIEQALVEARELHRTHAGELEKQVQVRTASLQESNVELEAFSYSISHDLRTPLRFVKGFTEAIIEDAANTLSPQSQDHVRRILHSTDRMETMIKDLLAYSRIGRAEMQIVDQPLDPVLAEVLTFHHQSIQQAGARVVVESPLPVVKADKTGLFQALSNLLSNAIKFSKRETPGVVRIRSEARGEHVRLWIEDNGIGIEPRHHERIFKLFERLHPAGEFPGSGIGLSLVRKAVQRMGGTCGVESTVGEGSRFWIDFPKGKAAALA